MRKFRQKWTLDRTKFMTEPEVRKLRKAVKDKAQADIENGRTTWPRFWMALDLALGAGMRVSEIAQLRIGNLYLSIEEPRLRVKGKEKRARDVFISRNLMNHLTEYINWKRLRQCVVESPKTRTNTTDIMRGLTRRATKVAKAHTY